MAVSTEVTSSEQQLTTTVPAQTFEVAMEQLELIVKQLESDSTSLDEAMRLYEDGVRLTRFCTQKLEEVEQKVLLLSTDRDMPPTTTAFRLDNVAS